MTAKHGPPGVDEPGYHERPKRHRPREVEGLAGRPVGIGHCLAEGGVGEDGGGETGERQRGSWIW